MRKIFEDADEREAATVVAAGIALHALLTRNGIPLVGAEHGVVGDAFRIAREFVKQAEQQ